MKYTEEGFADRVFHLHLRLTGDNDELYFRDYLRDHPEDAEKYQRLKLSLWKKFEYNRDAYTDAKGDFIKRCTNLSHLSYGDRYNVIRGGDTRPPLSSRVTACKGPSRQFLA